MSQLNLGLRPRKLTLIPEGRQRVYRAGSSEIFRGPLPKMSRYDRVPLGGRPKIPLIIPPTTHTIINSSSKHIAAMGSIQPRSVYVIDPYHDAAIEQLKQHPGIRLVLPEDVENHEYLEKANAVLMRSETILDAASIRKANPGLRIIIKQGVGVDNIDVKAAREKGIEVFNTPGLNGEAVAELAVALTLAIGRRVCEFDRKIRNCEKVVRSEMLGKSVFGKTIGVVGMGNIGLEVARKWQGAMSGLVVAYDPYAKDDAWLDKLPSKQFRRASSLEELLQDADVVTLHVPLTASTSNLISTREFTLMKQGVILVNCARGGIVDESALLEALDSGHVYGAGLDAMQYEPPSASAYSETLLRHPSVVMTPHVGASTVENQVRSGLAAVDILCALLEGDDGDRPIPVNA